ncbi:HoxN/HupN/NixA family nickel/cobalt transporter [Fluoribacter dumoffii]|uniref:HoxN/HupN/NixA family nickel/cobalt transporter n=1 Tax=Fluoribacter dumoffii TaxID=463 RepID=UPI002244B834|nr:HoxN/HupN/NixA family nickel/cobalt transporter [Fluoribacter dumoffii]MCW8386485.1 HoxN/HupN/NixA family nickel/cobalt transporter [Fluoribacter dumoffii]MCW8419538.1 HoxN/HupN/NixA family nickel/cobalt transporter [Fluoribacter dumoffii]MCW8455759.1 HoxN/HupN/NixA family nickel/cobalt transporter [Fluoribacter dumoffii]MCW8460162.1 HoxN/HupN/NixA family nickel/cobalt transporter [Fluoribacter dumoffii]MCW8483641.1 HoxN/HupN/NixA family nickel/cobalt transporter [Fluoribacter dumoffii]
MGRYLRAIYGNRKEKLRQKIVMMYLFLLLFNFAVWFWAFYSLYNFPLLFGSAVMAYSFGLRHAVDADHIAAIDNVTRKLLQEGKQPIGVGFFFSLGHSSVVIIATIIIALSTQAIMQANFDKWHQIGSIICTSCSAIFLLLMAVINILIFFSIYKTFTQIRKGKKFTEQDANELMGQNGFLVKRFRRVMNLISHSWQMFPLGFLFGIGFDTATEVGLLGLSATQASEGVSMWTILLFPALFTAGMTLIDTSDGIFMLSAYGWAFLKPVRKLYYNLTITLASALVALLVGGIEALNLIAGKTGWRGSFWNLINQINDRFNSLGFFIILFFILSWVVSIFIYKWMNFAALDEQFVDDKQRNSF